MEENVNVLPEGLEKEAPKGIRKFVVSKRAVVLYFAVILVLVAYMGFTAVRLGVHPDVACGAYNVSTIASAGQTFAWAFVHPGANVSTYVSHVCAGLQQSYKIQLPS